VLEDLATVQAFLRREPVLNSVPLSLVSRALASEVERAKLFVATVRDDGGIRAAALRSDFPKLAVAAGGTAEDLAELASMVHAQMPDLPCAIGRREEVTAFARAWQSRAGVLGRPGMMQRMYVLHAVQPHHQVSGTMRVAGPGDHDLVLRWFEAFEREAIPAEARQGNEAARESVSRRLEDGAIFLWIDGAPVSLAGARQFGEGVARIERVYTPPELRRRGYAGMLTARASQYMLDSGCTACCLFTDLSNPTSNHIYAEVGYTPLADFDEYWFNPNG